MTRLGETPARALFEQMKCTCWLINRSGSLQGRPDRTGKSGRTLDSQRRSVNQFAHELVYSRANRTIELQYFCTTSPLRMSQYSEPSILICADNSPKVTD